jgi:hypothetical protein
VTSIPHEPPTTMRRTRGWLPQALVGEVFASLAIGVMWLAVLFDSVFGPDIVTHDVSGSSAVVPSGVVVAFFAFLGTWVLARHCFGRRDGG